MIMNAVNHTVHLTLRLCVFIVIDNTLPPGCVISMKTYSMKRICMCAQCKGYAPGLRFVVLSASVVDRDGMSPWGYNVHQCGKQKGMVECRWRICMRCGISLTRSTRIRVWSFRACVHIIIIISVVVVICMCLFNVSNTQWNTIIVYF